MMGEVYHYRSRSLTLCHSVIQLNLEIRLWWTEITGFKPEICRSELRYDSPLLHRAEECNARTTE
jgi:hypothetical protein